MGVSDNEEFRRLAAKNESEINRLETKKLSGKRSILKVDALLDEIKFKKLCEASLNYA